MKQRIGGRGDLSEDAEISAGVSHAEGQLQRRHLTDTKNDDLTGVTTTPRGKRRDKCEVQGMAESDLPEEEHIIRQQLEILNQKQLHAAAAQAEAKAVAAAEADRARAAADRARAEADRARAASDREVARERLLLQHRQEGLKRQRYLAGNITERSNIPGHGGDDQPMPNDRHEHAAYEWGLRTRKRCGCLREVSKK